MRLKRLLSLVLCVALVAGTLFTVNASADGTQTDKSFDHCVGLLNALKITDDIDVYGNANRFVTRGEFASLIARIAPVDISMYENSAKFTDIEGDLAKDAAYACAMGFLKATGSVFNPDGYINAVDAIKAAVVLTGYDVRANAMGVGDSAYLSVANGANLTDGVEFYQYDKRINLSSLVRLFANILLTPAYEAVSFGTDISYGKGSTLIETKYNIYNTSGTINANNVSGIGRSTTEYGYVVIGDTEYSVGETNAADFLGYEVNAYYQEVNNARTLVYVDTNWYNEIVELDSTEVSYKDYTYYYLDGQKDREAELATEVEVIVNGESKVYDESIMLPKEGTITLINSDNDKQIETVVIKNALVGVVENFNQAENLMSVSTGDVIDFDLYSEENIKVIDQMTGSQKTTTDIIKDMIVTIFKSGSSITVYTSLVRESGTVNSIETTSEGLSIVYINDEPIEVSPYYTDNRGLKCPAVGDTGRFYLNNYGRIAYFQPTDDIWSYAYLIDVDCPSSGFATGYKFKLFSEADGGSMLVLDAAEKVRVNNVSCQANGKNKNGTDILAALSGNSQIVKYRTNSKGELNAIEFANGDGVGLEVHSDTKNGFVTLEHQNRTFKGIAAYSLDTKVFIIPNDADNNNEDMYRLTNYTYLRNSRQYSFVEYKSDATKMLADLMVVKRNETYADGTKGGVVTKKSMRLSEDGEAMDAVTIMDANGNEALYVAPGSNILKNIDVYDIVRVAISTGNNLVGCDVLYDYDKDTLNASYVKDLHNGMVMSKFKALRAEEGYIEINDADTTKYLNAAAASVIVCDMTNPNPLFYKGTIDSIKDEYTYGIGEEMIVQSRYYIADLIVVYKK